MAITNSMRYRSYFPYIVEGICALIFFLAIIFGFMVLTILLGKTTELTELVGSRWVILVLFIPILFECIIGHYNAMLLSIPEVCFNLYICEELRLVAWRQEPETILRYSSVLSWFFANHKYVAKEKLYFERTDGSVVQLRCVFHGLSREEKMNTRSKRKAWRTKYKSKPSAIKALGEYDKRMLNSPVTERVVYGRFSKVIITRGSVGPGKDGLWNRANFS